MIVSTGAIIIGVAAVSAIGLVVYLEKRRNAFYKAFVENKEAKQEAPFEFTRSMSPHVAEQPARRPIPSRRSSIERREEARRSSTPSRSGQTERRSHVEECSWTNNPANSMSPFNQAAQSSPAYDSTPARSCSPSYGDVGRSSDNNSCSPSSDTSSPASSD